jgi:hypothetical protein
MTDQHPITPPPELVQQWANESPMECSVESWAYELFIAHHAAQWGADQELEACCDHMRDNQWGFVDLPDGTKIHRAIYLQQTRRPKPPSLKEQAHDAYWALRHGSGGDRNENQNWDTIRRALEALPE